MKKFYISDIHLYQESVIKESQRPYSSIKEMHDDFIVKWNKKVDKNDIVYIVGDVASPSTEREIMDVVNILKLLKGNKILIIGNHDRESIKNLKFKKCFMEVKEYARVYDSGKKVVMFHYPMESWEGSKKGVIHIHGHIHKEPIAFKENRYNVGADVQGFEPKTLMEIMQNNEKGID